MDFFEGVEKLMEIWFTKLNGKVTLDNDLRDIPIEKIEEMLDTVNCKILSTTEHDDITEYVLSESSLFLTKNRIILKTCGTTTLLHAIDKILSYALQYSGYDMVEDIFYSRKKFARPDLQRSPHTTFEEETEYLQQYFPNGASYALGRLNGETWYLFTLDKQRSIGVPDQTFEIIMTKLDEDVMKIFTKDGSKDVHEATQKSGIDKIFPNAKLDAYLFYPCGYSVNAILPDGHYFTIHITPEPTCSYVSFETNAPVCNYAELVKKLLNIFKPGQFIFTFCANDKANGRDGSKKPLVLSDYKTDAFQLTEIKNYEVIYAQYTKRPI